MCDFHYIFIRSWEIKQEPDSRLKVTRFWVIPIIRPSVSTYKTDSIEHQLPQGFNYCIDYTLMWFTRSNSEGVHRYTFAISSVTNGFMIRYFHNKY